MRSLITAAVVAALAGCTGGSGGPATEAATPPVVEGPIVFVGDSITARWFAAEYTDGHTLAKLVPGAVDAGVPGDTTKQMLARYSGVLALHPRLVVILGGTNDLYTYPDAATVDNIAAMAEQASAGGAAVVIGLTPPTHDWGLMQYGGKAGNAAVKLWDADLRTLAHAYGYGVADYYSALVNPDGSEDSALFIADGIHPDAAGYVQMWNIVKSKIGTTP